MDENQPPKTGSPSEVDAVQSNKPAFPPRQQQPDPTHEAYEFDKLKNVKRVVAQGSEREIKMFRDLHRKRGNWLYMRPIEEPPLEQVNADMLSRRTPVLGE